MTILLVVTAHSNAAMPPASVNVRVVVVDQKGDPVSGADCKLGFDAPPNPPQTEGSLILNGVTDADGILEVAGKTRLSVYCTVTKSGYYQSYKQHEFDQAKILNAFGEGKPLEKWQLDPLVIKVELKRIVKPIAMYACKVEAKILDGQPLGFDLVECDWVAPHGKGKTSDLVFTSTRNITDPKQWNGELKLTFSNKGDGIQSVFAPAKYGSELRLPYEASEKGYQNEWSQKTSSSQYAESRADQNYFFRVRTVLDEKGEVKSALYGKIHGDISYYVGAKAPQAGLGFTYYLNPKPNDRNVEFDVQRNLFTGLKGAQAVKNP